MNFYKFLIMFLLISKLVPIKCMVSSIEVLAQPAAPHNLNDFDQINHRLQNKEKHKKKCLQIRFLMFKKKFDEALAALKEKDKPSGKTLIIDQAFFVLSVKSGNLPIVREALKHEGVGPRWAESSLLDATKDEQIPIVKRLLWECLIQHWQSEWGFHKEQFDMVMVNISRNRKSHVIDCINSFYNSIDWQNVQHAVNDIIGNIAVHEAVETCDPQILSDSLLNNAPFFLYDEYDELPLAKARRLAKEEKDLVVRKKRVVFSKMIGIFAKRGYCLFDLLKLFEKERTNELKHLISALLKGWAPFLSCNFYDSEKNTVLHAAVDLALFDFVKLITCLNPELLGCTNNRGENPILRAFGQGRKCIYEWFCGIPKEVNRFQEIESSTEL